MGKGDMHIHMHVPHLYLIINQIITHYSSFVIYLACQSTLCTISYRYSIHYQSHAVTSMTCIIILSIHAILMIDMHGSVPYNDYSIIIITILWSELCCEASTPSFLISFQYLNVAQESQTLRMRLFSEL